MSIFQVEYTNLSNTPKTPFKDIKVCKEHLNEVENLILDKFSINDLLKNEKYKLDSSSSYSSNSSLSDYIQTSSCSDDSEYTDSGSEYTDSECEYSDDESVEKTSVGSHSSNSSSGSLGDDSVLACDRSTDDDDTSDYNADESDDSSNDEDSNLLDEEFLLASNEWDKAIGKQETGSDSELISKDSKLEKKKINTDKDCIERARLWSKKWHLLVTREPKPFSPNLYEILELDEDCSYNELKKSFNQLKEKTRVCENKNKTFLEIQEAYRVLSEDYLRHFYNNMLMAHRGVIIYESESESDESTSDESTSSEGGGESNGNDSDVKNDDENGADCENDFEN